MAEKKSKTKIVKKESTQKIMVHPHKVSEFEAKGYKKVGSARGGSVHMEKTIVTEEETTVEE